MTTLRQAAAQAATAAERLAVKLANDGTDDSVVVAYLLRLRAAVAKAEDYAQRGLTNIPADPNYLGPLRHDPRTTATRQP